MSKKLHGHLHITVIIVDGGKYVVNTCYEFSNTFNGFVCTKGQQSPYTFEKQWCRYIWLIFNLCILNVEIHMDSRTT